MTTTNIPDSTITHLGARLITDDERKRLEVLVPDPLVRAEVLLFIEEARLHGDIDDLLFKGALTPAVGDGGELVFLLTESGIADIERRLAQGGGVRVSVDGGA